MHVLEMDVDLCEAFLQDRYHTRTTKYQNGDGFTAWFTCGRGPNNALGRPMNIPGELEADISFMPYEAADRNLITIWSSKLADVSERSRARALELCNSIHLKQTSRFIKPFISDEGGLYCGAQGLVDEEASSLRLIVSFLEEMDEFWPTVSKFNMLP